MRRLGVGIVVAMMTLFVAPIGAVRAVALPTISAWDGGGDGVRWSDAANWVGDAVPVDGDVLSFDLQCPIGNRVWQRQIDDLGRLTVAGIQYATTCSGLAVTGTERLTIGGPLVSTVEIALRFDLPVSLGVDVAVHAPSYWLFSDLDFEGHLVSVDGGVFRTDTTDGAGTIDNNGGTVVVNDSPDAGVSMASGILDAVVAGDVVMGGGSAMLSGVRSLAATGGRVQIAFADVAGNLQVKRDATFAPGVVINPNWSKPTRVGDRLSLNGAQLDSSGFGQSIDAVGIGGTVKLFDVAEPAPVGQFQGIAEGVPFRTPEGYGLALSYHAGDGNDVVATVLDFGPPVPTTTTTATTSVPPTTAPTIVGQQATTTKTAAPTLPLTGSSGLSYLVPIGIALAGLGATLVRSRRRANA